MNSKIAALTKVEQDALRYRAFARTLLEQLDVTLTQPNGQRMRLDVSVLDQVVDQLIKVEDVAEVLIESTHASLQLASSSSIEESCVQATREIASSLERGIYQPLMPLDAQHLLACAKLAEERRQR